MFNDDNDGGGLGLNIPALGAVGEVMLILFVTVVMTMSVKAQMIQGGKFGGARGKEPPAAIGLKVMVGPGSLLSVDGESMDLEPMLAKAEKIAEEAKVLVQMDVSGDPVLFWKVRFELRDRGCVYVEAPPVNSGDRRVVKK